MKVFVASLFLILTPSSSSSPLNGTFRDRTRKFISSEEDIEKVRRNQIFYPRIRRRRRTREISNDNDNHQKPHQVQQRQRQRQQQQQRQRLSLIDRVERDSYKYATVTSSIFLPRRVARNFALLCRRRPTLVSIGFGVACGMGYYCLFNPSNPNANTVAEPGNYRAAHDKQELPFHVVVGRVFSFWKKAAPIIVHYKFATLWMNRIKHYDRNRRDGIYESLHEKYAPKAKDVILELKGLFIKVGQVMSSRPDFMPGIYIDHFNELQDNVPAYPSEEIKSILSASLLQHHGLKFNEVFAKFTEEPLGQDSGFRIDIIV